MTAIEFSWKQFVNSGKTKAIVKALMTKRKGDPAERPSGFDPSKSNDYYRQNSLIGSSLDDLVDSVCGAGIRVKVVDIETDEEIPYSDIPEFAAVMRASRPNWTVYRAIHDAIRIHDGYIVKKYKGNAITAFAPVPPNEMRVDRSPTMEVLGYYQELGSESDWVKFKPAEIVQIKNKEITGEAYGVSLIERVAENSDILRDIGLDFAKFMATKAYPPTVWGFGSAERPWSDADIKSFMDSLEDIDPGAQIGVRGDVTATTLNPDVQMPDVVPSLTYYTSTVVNGLGVPAVSTGLLSDSGMVGDLQEKAYSRRVNTMRTLIGEQLEIELFDEILVSNGYEDMQTQIIWNQHDDEEQRMLVNDIVQLAQNGFLTREFGQTMLGFPTGPNMHGEYLKIVDQAEGGDPSIPKESDQNTKDIVEEDGDEDGRTGSKRQNV